MNIIDHPSPNFDSRSGTAPTMLIMHYTGMKNGPAALERLSDPTAKVSSHYVVEEDGRVYQLVNEADCAWHAGVSSWRGLGSLNMHSIGIEIVNPGHEFGYRGFPLTQMRSVLALSQAIVTRHAIAPRNIIGHSDIAPMRKIDPGELFDWEWLASNGIGQAVPQIGTNPYDTQLWTGDSGDAVRRIQQQLKLYGYSVELTGVYDTQTEINISAFQRHFRRTLVTGIADAQTQSVLAALIAAL